MRARVSIFLGKGGVGKTSLAAAFAVDRAVKGERVLLLSLTSNEDLPQRLREEAAGAPIDDRLELLALEPKALVDDLVRKITRLGPMADYLVKHPSYESLVDVTPGLREMATFHYVFNAAQGGDYDRVVVDGPATGHGLHFLEAPEKTTQILVGKLRERAEEISRRLRDPEGLEVVIVTIPEEMPVRETLDLASRLDAQGFPLDNVVVNRWLPRVFHTPESKELLDRLNADPDALRDLGRAIAHRTKIDVEQWRTAMNLVRGQRDENLAHLRDLLKLDAKVSLVPLIPEPEGRLLRVAEEMVKPVPEDLAREVAA